MKIVFVETEPSEREFFASSLADLAPQFVAELSEGDTAACIRAFVAGQPIPLVNTLLPPDR